MGRILSRQLRIAVGFRVLCVLAFGQLEPGDRFAAQLEFQPSCVQLWAVPVAVLGREERSLAEDNGDGSYRAVDAVEGVRLRCFPDLYARLAGSQPDQVMPL